MALYKAIVEYIRAYANFKADFVEAKLSEAEINKFNQKLDEYLDLREVIRIASGETIDLKAYEADMRFLIDTYIRAEESEKISPFDDISLLDLIEADMDKAVDSLLYTIYTDLLKNISPKGNKSKTETYEDKVVHQNLLIV